MRQLFILHTTNNNYCILTSTTLNEYFCIKIKKNPGLFALAVRAKLINQSKIEFMMIFQIFFTSSDLL